jgi:hypothetical protein
MADTRQRVEQPGANTGAFCHPQAKPNRMGISNDIMEISTQKTGDIWGSYLGYFSQQQPFFLHPLTATF